MKKAIVNTYIFLPIAFILFSLAGGQFSEDVSKRPNAYFSLSYTPSDPLYTGVQKVSGLYGNCYQNISMNHIGNIENVWDSYKGDGVTIAIIDTGIDIEQSDFSTNVSEKSGYFTSNAQYIGKQYITHDYSDGKYSDHGSSVAGVAAASTNSKGCIGIAPNAELLVLKVDLSDSSLVKAIKYAADQGADVINMSLGAYAEPYVNGNDHKTYDKEYEDYYPSMNAVLTSSINYAYNKNCIIVAAAGNECTETNSYPASNSHVIGVGALAYNSSNQKASFSNYNKSTAQKGNNCNVDIVAPGYVVSNGYDGSSNYKQTQGTSFSSPIVAGAAALWKQKNPNGTQDEFEKALFESADDIGQTGWDTTFGYGALNIYALMTDFDVDETNIQMDNGTTHQIKVTKPKESYAVTYSSSNNDVAKVSSTGLITAVGQGNAFITVICNGVEKKIKVTVVGDKPTPQPIKLGCQGEISTTSIIISLSAIALISIIYIKKKKREK